MEGPAKSNVAIDLITASRCTGCGGCSDSCRSLAATMQVDREGFYRPVVDRDTCTDCGVCVMHCPVVQSESKQPAQGEISVFGGWLNQQDALRKSASGGIAFALASRTIADGGVVVGCVMGDGLMPEHTVAESKDAVEAMQGSKYLPSRLGDVYSKAAAEAARGSKVLFVGTPCQVAAFETFLKPSFRDNVVTADLICFGVPSMLAWHKYVADTFGNRLKSVNFRGKSSGWSNFSVEYTMSDGARIFRNHRRDPFFAPFLTTMFHQEICLNCPFAKIPRTGDLTLGDFWGVPEQYANEGGVSVLLVSNDRGQQALDRLRNEGLITLFPATLAMATRANPRLIKPLDRRHPRREEVLRRLVAGETFKSAVKDHSLKGTVDRILKPILPRDPVGGIKRLLKRVLPSRVIEIAKKVARRG